MVFKAVGVLVTIFLFNLATSHPVADEEAFLQENVYENLYPRSGERLEEIEYQAPHIRERRALLEELESQPLYDYAEVEEEQELPLVRERRQLFGGRSGSTHQVGYRAGPAWGSMAHSGGPITYSAGANFNSRAGHGLSGSLSHTPGLGGQGSVRGTVGLINTPNHQLSAWGQHSRNFDSHVRRLGPETNSAGLNYQHGSGASAFLSGSKTPGFPSSGSVGGSIPLHSSPTSSVSLSGQTNFARGMKPNHQVLLGISKSF